MTTTVGLILSGLAAVVLANLLARRSGQPVAVLLVAAGVIYAWLPGPNIVLRPSLVLDLVIPPLLYGAALSSSALGLRRSIRPVASLSVGLVVATALLVGAAVFAVTPGLPISAAIALGAAVAPTDPVAALAIGRRGGLLPNLVTIIEGEGLLNDATALTLLQIAVASAVGGGFSALHIAGEFLLAVVGGAVAGLVVAVVLGSVRRRIQDPLTDNALSLGTPFAAYLLARAMSGSGVLAVVVAGLWFAHRGPVIQTGPSRLQARAVWTLVEYLLEGFVFILIGQQLPTVVRGLHAYPTDTVVAAGAVTVGVVLLIRPLWLAVSEILPARFHSRLGDAVEPTHRHLATREVIALTWMGTRGVITLAAVFSLPLTMDDGRPFPGRDLLLFCAYLVVLVTLVGQGLTLAPLLHRLRFGSTDAADAVVRNQARAAAVQVALARLDELRRSEGLADEIAAPLRQAAQRRLDRYLGRIERLADIEDGGLPPDDPYFTAARVRRELIEAERNELIHWRDTGRLPDASLRILQRELDHEEGLLPGAEG
jgi:CPA1 family monovalent cation:H+ antiporter